MTKEKQALIDWKICVQRAKKNLNKGTDTWGIIRKDVLQEAMRCYCAMGY
jgi:hypothetical protein